MKNCTKCYRNLSLDNYPIKHYKNKPNVTLSFCRDCYNKYYRDRYKNKPQQKLAIKRHDIKIKELVSKIKIETGCFICKYNKCPRSLHFHHIDKDSKSCNISSIQQLHGDVLKEEIKKCIVLCSNCHGEVESGYIELNIDIEKFQSKPIFKQHICKCGKFKDRMSKQCIKCTKLKYNHPTKEQLEKLIWEKSIPLIAKDFNISITSINRLCIKYGIDKPPRGYWAKVYNNKI